MGLDPYQRDILVLVQGSITDFQVVLKSKPREVLQSLLSFLGKWLLGIFKFFDRMWINDTLTLTLTFQISLYCIPLCLETAVFFMDPGSPEKASFPKFRKSPNLTETYSQAPQLPSHSVGVHQEGLDCHGKTCNALHLRGWWLDRWKGPKGKPVK